MMLLNRSAPVVRVIIYLYSALVFFCYADDILLIAPSVQSLQTLLHLCEAELIYLDMCINSKKSVCIRFSSRFDVKCFNITTLKGNALEWVGVCRYLGMFFSKWTDLKMQF